MITTGLVAAAATTDLRREVLRPGWAPGRPMAGDDDPAALHVAALDRGVALSACVLLPAACPHHPGAAAAWQLRGMATAAARRGEGLGTRVVTAALAVVHERGGTLVWCRARLDAAPLYARLGFGYDTDEYVEPHTGLPHRDMSTTLPVGAGTTRGLRPG